MSTKDLTSYTTSTMEWLRKLCDGQGEEIAALHGELRSFRTEVERLRAALTEIVAMSEPAGYEERSKAQIRDVARRSLDA